MAIHGNKSQGARTRALAQFKDGTLPVLVATDIAARGLDIDDLPHVVNYELPHVPEDYVHRIGRTGRAGREGSAVSLVDREEVKLLTAIERVIRHPDRAGRGGRLHRPACAPRRRGTGPGRRPPAARQPARRPARHAHLRPQAGQPRPSRSPSTRASRPAAPRHASPAAVRAAPAQRQARSRSGFGGTAPAQRRQVNMAGYRQRRELRGTCGGQHGPLEPGPARRPVAAAALLGDAGHRQRHLPFGPGCHADQRGPAHDLARTEDARQRPRSG